MRYFSFPDMHIMSLSFSPDGSTYIVTQENNIYSICIESKEISLVGKIDALHGFVLSPDGQNMIICDFTSHCLRSICFDSENVTIFAGTPSQKGLRNGPREQALFDSPTNVIYSKCGNFLFVSDSQNGCIRIINIK